MKEFLVSLYLTMIRNMVGKYSKILLGNLESANVLSPQVRKHVLDSYNDMYREIVQRMEGS